MDALHYALLAVVVLLAVYAFGSFRESLTPKSACMNKCQSRHGHGPANFKKCETVCRPQHEYTGNINMDDK